jgi:hypothetical protein
MGYVKRDVIAVPTIVVKARAMVGPDVTVRKVDGGDKDILRCV